MDAIELSVLVEQEGVDMNEPVYPYFEDIGESVTNLELDRFINLVYAAM